jgi:hypothetical protein
LATWLVKANSSLAGALVKKGRDNILLSGDSTKVLVIGSVTSQHAASSLTVNTLDTHLVGLRTLGAKIRCLGLVIGKNTLDKGACLGRLWSYKQPLDHQGWVCWHPLCSGCRKCRICCELLIPFICDSTQTAVPHQ